MPPAPPTAEQVLQSMEAHGVRMGEPPSGEADGPRAEDLGVVVRKAWSRLAPAWTEPRAAELRKARLSKVAALDVTFQNPTPMPGAPAASAPSGVGNVSAIGASDVKQKRDRGCPMM